MAARRLGRCPRCAAILDFEPGSPPVHCPVCDIGLGPPAEETADVLQFSATEEQRPLDLGADVEELDAARRQEHAELPTLGGGAVDRPTVAESRWVFLASLALGTGFFGFGLSRADGIAFAGAGLLLLLFGIRHSRKVLRAARDQEARAARYLVERRRLLRLD